MLVLLGPGLNELFEFEKLPQTGDIVNLGGVLTEGQYRLTETGDKEWSGDIFPYYTFARIGDIPTGGTIKQAAALLNC